MIKIDIILKIAKKLKMMEHQKRIPEKLKNLPGIIAFHGMGSGKTLTAINAANKLGIPAVAVVPASLRENFKKEIDKFFVHTGKTPDIRVMSYEEFSKIPPNMKDKMLILDEAHRIKNESSARSKVILEKSREAEKRLLLTGTPVQNKPHDISMLVNVASGKDILPTNEYDFNKEFIDKSNSSIFNILNKDKGPRIKNKDKYYNSIEQFIDVHKPSKEDLRHFPEVLEENVPINMSEEQYKAYIDAEKGTDSSVINAINKMDTISNRKDISKLNAFLSKTRQISNFDYSGKASPKVEALIGNVQKETERAPALIYSNYLDYGVGPISEELSNRGITNGVFTGEMNDKQKREMIENYNRGNLRTLIISSAGAEGLDLKGTGSVHILEPHWNNPKLEQVKSRAARYMSHSHLPEKERYVNVYNYLSTRPKNVINRMFPFVKPRPTTDEYLFNLSLNKEKLNNQFLNLGGD